MCFPLSLVEVEVDLHHIEGTMILRIDTGKTGRKKKKKERERHSKIQRIPLYPEEMGLFGLLP